MTYSCTTRAIDILPAATNGSPGALVVNIFGGPGTGKSTLASELYCALKKAGIETACPEEHAKLAIWSGQPWLLDHQVILLGRTWETIRALSEKVDVIIVDSPILLCSVYAQDREPDCFHELVIDIHRRTSRMNILLQRNPGQIYSPSGRRETADQASLVDARIENLLRTRSETYSAISRAPDDRSAIARSIATYLSDRS